MPRTLRRAARIASIVVLCAIPLVFSGCHAPTKQIAIGAIAMLEGENAINGRNMVDAATLAVKEANARGGLCLGRRTVKVALLVEKDPNTPEGALNAARTLIAENRVAAIIGPQFSGNAIPVARFAESSRIVMIAPMSTNPETTSGKRFVFRIPYLDTFQGFVLARFAHDELKVRRAAVLYDVAGDYNKTLAEEFRRIFQERGGTVVDFETYTTDRNKDFNAQLRRIRAARPDILFLPNYATDVRVQAAEARAMGIEATLLGGDGWDTAFAVERDFDGAYVAWQWHPSIASSRAKVFIADFQAATGRIPENVAAATYDACGILFAAMEAAGTADPEAVQRMLHGMGPFEGVTGRIGYSEGGDPRKSAVIMHFTNGEAAVHAVVEP
jgi:branched-chain amino acid transport system substrate-binding protein